MTTYTIYDTRNKVQVGGVYTNSKRASRRVDKLDQEYGAYRYVVRTIFSNELTTNGEMK